MKCKFNLLIATLLALLAPLAASAEPISVYLLKSSTGWSDAYIHSWDSSNKNLTGNWGSNTKLSTVEINGETYWYYTFSEDVTSVSVIFKNAIGNTDWKCDDILNITETTFYKMSGTSGAATEIDNPLKNLVAPTISFDEHFNTVSIATTSSAAIYYTSDGSDPKENGILYDGEFAIDKDVTINAYAKLGSNETDVVSANLTYIDPNSRTSVFVTKKSVEDIKWTFCKVYAWNGSKYNNAFPGDEMKITSIDGVDYYFYIYDEGVANFNVLFDCMETSSSTNAQTVDVKGVTTGAHFYEISTETTGGKYNVTSLENLLSVSVPTIYSSNNVVTITADSGATIYYTTDGSTPSESSAVYTESFELAADATIKAIAVRNGKTSDIATYDFIWHYAATAPADNYIYYPVATGATAQICTDAVYLPMNGGSPTTYKSLEKLYILGDNLKDANGNVYNWVGAEERVSQDYRYNDILVYEKVTLSNYFTFAKVYDSWDNVNSNYNRLGPSSDQTPLSLDGTSSFADGKNNSWEVEAGDYRVVVDLNAKTVTLTKVGSGPAFTDMTATTVADDHVSVKGKDLYRTKISEDFVGKKIALKSGDSAIDVTPAADLDATQSYILSDGALVATEYADVEIDPETAHVHTGKTPVHATESTAILYIAYDADVTDACELNNGEYVITTIADGESALPANALVTINWAAENAQGLRYHGSYQIINHSQDAADVEIYCYAPSSWTGAKCTITSTIDGTSKEYTFDSTWGSHITVPAELFYSKVVISNVASTEQPAEARRRAGSTTTYDDSYEFTLAGESRYFVLNSWQNKADAENALSGINDFANDAVEAPVEYYNLQGVRVENPSNGIYIRRQGSSITKIAL